LENAGIRLQGGSIATQATQQTSVPHVFAAGDVAGPYEIVHIAIQQGEIAARNAARLLGRNTGALERSNYRLKMAVVFTQPEAAWCGWTEKELREKGIAYRSASHPFNDHGKSMIMGAKYGFVKLLASARSGEILGGQIVGPCASDLIHEVVMAMRFRCTVHQFKAVPHYHPTLAEILTYPAEDLSGQLGGK
jgi:pyruvate/2-oxoglutarate dehydrogenase complex dihydrolipoamide dehydrogenase (E3) component